MGPSPVLRSARALVFADDLDAPQLRPEDDHHLFSVLRLRDGEVVVTSDGSGRWRACRAARHGGSEELTPDGPVVQESRPRPAICVAFSLAKGDRTEWAVSKLVELGADRIVPLVCERTVARPRPTGSSKFRRIATEAAMQSRRVFLPEIAEATPFRSVFDSTRPGTTALCEPGGDRIGLSTPTVLIGPEGGWSSAELDFARDSGAAFVGLSDGVLRIETAAVAAGALLGALRHAACDRPPPSV